MVRLAPLLLALTLAACAVGADTAPPPADAGWAAAEEVGPSPTPDLRGRWTITAVNGRPQSGLWLELGGEGLAKITTKGSGVYVGSPQPPTRAYLGCNWWDPSGWTRSGNNLTLGVEMSRRTERGCEAAREALDDEAYAILRKPLTMEFIPPNRLHLANGGGTLELIRTAVEATNDDIVGKYVVKLVNGASPTINIDGHEPTITIGTTRIHFQSQCIYADWTYKRDGEAISTESYFKPGSGMCARGLAPGETAIQNGFDKARTIRATRERLYLEGGGYQLELHRPQDQGQREL